MGGGWGWSPNVDFLAEKFLVTRHLLISNLLLGKR